jgi:hypothetical protein
MQELNQSEPLVGSSSSTTSSSLDMEARVQVLKKNSQDLIEAAAGELVQWGIEEDTAAEFCCSVVGLTSAIVRSLGAEKSGEISGSWVPSYLEWISRIVGDELLTEILKSSEIASVYRAYSESVHSFLKVSPIFTEESECSAQMEATFDLTSAEINAEISESLPLLGGPCSSTDTRRSVMLPREEKSYDLASLAKKEKVCASSRVMVRGSRVDCIIEDFVSKYPSQLDLLMTLSDTEALIKLERAIQAKQVEAAQESFFALKAILSTVDALCASYFEDLVVGYYPSLREVYTVSSVPHSSSSAATAPAPFPISLFFDEAHHSDTPRPLTSSPNHSDEEDRTRVCPLTGERYDPNEPYVSKRRTSPGNGHSAS